MKERKKDEEKGVVESFLGAMPIFGDFFDELGKSEVFKERFKEVNKQIEENLRKGGKKKWRFEANISVRPIIKQAKEDKKEIGVGEDYFYGKKGGKLVLAIKAPKESMDLEIKDKTLVIRSDGFERKLELPDYFRNIKKKAYKKGLLLLELTK